MASSEAGGGDAEAGGAGAGTAPSIQEPPAPGDEDRLWWARTAAYFERSGNPNDAFVSRVGREALGLSAGDQITAVNGVDVSDFSSLDSQMQRFLASGQAVLTIEDDSGRARELNLVLPPAAGESR